MTEKRYRTERIEGATLPFIVDNYSAKKINKTSIGYKAYDTNTMKKCEELTDLLNNYEKEVEKLKHKIKSIAEILNEDLGYIDSFKKIEEVIEND